MSLLLGVILALAAPAASAGGTPAARGLDPSRALTQYALDLWTTDDELPQNVVNTIAQTRDGYLWLGTYEGLARFDGIRFVTWTSATDAGIRSNGIRALAEDATGALWIGTNGGGVSRLVAGKATHFSAEQGLPDAMVWALHVDREGTVWAGTSEGGLYRLENERFVREANHPGEPVYVIHRDGKGVLWVGTHGGGLRTRGMDGKWTSFTARSGLPHDFVRAVAEDSNGSIWIGTLGGGVARLRDGRITTYGVADGLPSNIVSAILEDRAGTMWFAGTAGLARLRGDRFDALTPADGLPAAGIYAMAEDDEGSLWIGTNGGGLCRLRDGKFTTFTSREGLVHDYVYAIYEDDAGAIWLGTTAGLSRFAGGRFESFTTARGLPHEMVRSITGDGSGGVYVATYGGGVAHLSNGRFRTFRSADGLAHDSTRSVLRSRVGDLWVGTVDGVSRLRDGKWTTFTGRDGLPNNSVISILEDREGNLWIGTDGRGLARYRDGRFEAFTSAEGLGGAVVLCTYQDDEGTLWVGTNGGLARWDGTRFFTATTRDGLPSDSINQVLDDRRGNLWVGTSRGIARLAKADFVARAQGGGPLRVWTFGRADGLRSIQCTAPGQPAGLRTRDGRLWFATSKGVAVLDPEDIRTDVDAPRMHVEGVIADERSLAAKGGLELAPGTQRLAIHYTGVCLLAPSRVTFRYRLEGYDADWVNAGTRRVAYYTRLPPGSYVFRVSGCNGDGVCSDEATALALTLRPRFYQRNSFYVAGAALAVLALLFGHSRRVARLRERERELALLVEERTRGLAEQKRRAEEANNLKTELLGVAAHDLKNPLQAIMGLAETLGWREELSADTTSVLETIRRSASRMFALIDDLLARAALEGGGLDLTLATVDAGALAASVVEHLQGSADRKGQRIELQAGEGCLVRADERRMHQVLENLVGNAVKFSPTERTIRVVVRQDAAKVRIEVRDEGPGLSAQDHERMFQRFQKLSARPTGGEPSTGLGLSIVQRLVERHEGRVWAESAGPGRGATFIIELPRLDARAGG